MRPEAEDRSPKEMAMAVTKRRGKKIVTAFEINELKAAGFCWQAELEDADGGKQLFLWLKLAGAGTGDD